MELMSHVFKKLQLFKCVFFCCARVNMQDEEEITPQLSHVLWGRKKQFRLLRPVLLS